MDNIYRKKILNLVKDLAKNDKTFLADVKKVLNQVEEAQKKLDFKILMTKKIDDLNLYSNFIVNKELLYEKLEEFSIEELIFLINSKGLDYTSSLKNKTKEDLIKHIFKNIEIQSNKYKIL